MDIDHLSSTWIDYTENSRLQESDPNKEWAAVKLCELSFFEPDQCWLEVVNITRLTTDEWVLANLGAGPIETLLAQHPEAIIHKIESAFPKNRSLQIAIGSVWKNLIPDEYWDRLQALRNTPVKLG